MIVITPVATAAGKYYEIRSAKDGVDVTTIPCAEQCPDLKVHCYRTEGEAMTAVDCPDETSIAIDKT